jgi:tetratricopeptide (TPR) repeat protein
MSGVGCILCARNAEGALLCGACGAVFHEICRARDAGCPACGSTETALRHVPKKRMGLTRRALLASPFLAAGGAALWALASQARAHALLKEAAELEREVEFAAALKKTEQALPLALGDLAARAQHLRGRLYTTLGQYDRAEAAFLAIPPARATPASLDDHGILARLRGDLATSIERHNAALTDKSSTPQSQMWSFIRLAEAHHLYGRLDLVPGFLSGARQRLKKAGYDVLMDAHLDDLEGRVLEDTSGMYYAQARYMSGLVAVDKELREKDRLLGAERRASLEMLAGWFLHARGQYPEARERYLRALVLRRVHEKKRRLSVAATLARLAWIDRNLGQTGHARKKLDEALELREAAFHANHPMVGETLEQMVALTVEGDSKQLALRAQSIRAAMSISTKWKPPERMKPFQRMIAYSPLTLWRV